MAWEVVAAVVGIDFQPIVVAVVVVAAAVAGFRGVIVMVRGRGIAASGFPSRIGGFGTSLLVFAFPVTSIDLLGNIAHYGEVSGLAIRTVRNDILDAIREAAVVAVTVDLITPTEETSEA